MYVCMYIYIYICWSLLHICIYIYSLWSFTNILKIIVSIMIMIIHVFHLSNHNQFISSIFLHWRFQHFLSRFGGARLRPWLMIQASGECGSKESRDQDELWEYLKGTPGHAAGISFWNTGIPFWEIGISMRMNIYGILGDSVLCKKTEVSWI